MTYLCHWLTLWSELTQWLLICLKPFPGMHATRPGEVQTSSINTLNLFFYFSNKKVLDFLNIFFFFFTCFYLSLYCFLFVEFSNPFHQIPASSWLRYSCFRKPLDPVSLDSFSVLPENSPWCCTYHSVL